MRSVLLQKPRTLEVIETDDPLPPGAGEALVRVHRVGICGTDVSGYLGKMPFFSYPRIPGHELGVEVVEVGEGVRHIAAGDRCSIEPYMNCGDCHACRKGLSNCCADLKVIGVMIDGGLRERFVVRADKLHPSQTLAYEQLALVETLAIGCHAVDRAELRRGEWCVVIGAGPIGLATLEFVKLSGARTIAIDMDPQRLAFCREVMGVDHTLEASEHVPQALRELTGGVGPDVVMDATGSADSMTQALQLIAPTGRVVFVGITTDEIRFAHPPFHRAEGTLLCSRNALPGDFSRIIGLIERGEIDTGPWITHRSSMDDLPAAFAGYAQRGSGVVKAMVELG